MTTKILVFASNPQDTRQLRLGREIRLIEDALQEGEKREDFTVESLLETSSGDLLKTIRRKKPKIVHFCGHGMGNQGLVLANSSGQKKLLDTDAIADLFKLFVHQVECVVLNACFSKFQAEEINQHINYVVGTKKEIRDDAAVAFSKGFYESLFDGETIERAYYCGCNSIQTEIYNDSNRDRKLVPIDPEEDYENMELPQHEVIQLLIKKPLNRIAVNNSGSGTMAQIFPKGLQIWEEKRYEFIDKLSCLLNNKLDHSLFFVNSFLLSSKFIEEFILDYRDLKEKLEELSIISVTNKICPLVACSEWCRQRFNNPRDIRSFSPKLAKEIENLLSEVINYREGIDLNKIREFVKDSFDKYKDLIQQDDLRLQIEIEPKVDENSNTGLANGLFSLNMNLWIASKDMPLGRFAENEVLNLQTNDEDSCGELCDRLRVSLEREDFLSNLIRKARYSLPVAVKLKIEFFVPFELFQVSWEKICFKSGRKRKSFGAEYPIFINSYERYFDPDFREIRDHIQSKKQDFWSEDNSLEPDEFFLIGTQPSEDDLERIEAEFAIAVWNRCEDDFLANDSDIEKSKWKNLPQNICNLRKHTEELELTLFWDDLYPKPSDYTRPLNTDLVE